MNYRLLLAVSAIAIALPVATPVSAASFDPTVASSPSIGVDQGLGFAYVDPQLASIVKNGPRQQRMSLLQTAGFGPGGLLPQDQGSSNPMYLQLRQGLERYQATWGQLPNMQIPAGAALKTGASGERVDMLRLRLGLPAGGGFDAPLAERVTEYQRVHGLKATGVADDATVHSLNLGAGHYLRRIAVNLERARRLPDAGQFGRYVLVDSAAAEVLLVNGDRVADSMRAIVGSAEHKTPMMAVMMQNAKVNPYWNVPPDLIRRLTAPRVLKDGVSYLKNFRYEVLPDWNTASQPINPATVDWNDVLAGKSNIRVRQLPGPTNSMGAMKFEMPNRFGIYLHDTPKKELFASANRWVSNGCVRLEDARRFASWVFGDVPQAEGTEQQIDLPRPVPVYMTYLTVAPSANGVQFRSDPYNYDAQAAQNLFSTPQQMASI